MLQFCSWTYQISEHCNNVKVIIQCCQVKRSIAVILLQVDVLGKLTNEVLNRPRRQQANKAVTRDLWVTVPDVTYGRKPILAASCMGVKSRKLSKVGSAPASSNTDTDSFFCANTAQCRAVSPSES